MQTMNAISRRHGWPSRTLRNVLLIVILQNAIIYRGFGSFDDFMHLESLKKL